MSTITKDGRDILKQAKMSYSERTKAGNKRKILEDKRKRFKFSLAKRTKRHDIRMAKIGAHLRDEEYTGSEFSSSIPDETSTIASLVRGGFQSPTPSPPRTPPSGFSKPFYGTVTPLSLPKTRPPERPPSETGTDDEKDIESESDISGAYSDFWHHQDESTDEGNRVYRRQQDIIKRRRRHIAGMDKQHRVVTIPRDGTDINVSRAVRARQRKARKAFKQTRVNQRHKIRSHAPVVPKLQINQKGPGHFSVRSTGITDAVKKQVKSLLSRVKGKIFVNDKFTATKRAYSVIIALLQKKQIIDIQIK
jgi:hypothetical protein